MDGVKISGLPGTSSIDGSEIMPVVKGGNTINISVKQIFDLVVSNEIRLEFNWSGTSLGVRVHGDTTYTYVNLKGDKGDEGVGILNITKDHTSGLSDIYKITFTDNTTTTFTVVNGSTWIIGSDLYWYKDGVKTEYYSKGEKGDTGLQGIQGEKGDTGLQGIQGDKGDTGNSGVALQDTEPTDPNIKVWIKEDGSGDNFYTASDVDGLLGDKLDKTSIVQIAGTNTDKVISQNAITLLLKAITDNADLQGNVMAEAIVLLLNEVNVLKERLANGNLGDIHVTSITSDSMYMYCGQPLVVKGSGSPVTNAVLPAFEGQMYVDTTNRNIDASADASSPTYWKQLN